MTPALLLLCFGTADPVANPDEVALEEITAESVVDVNSEASGATATTAEVAKEATTEPKSPYRDSKVELGLSTRALGLNKADELMYNPSTIMALRLKPHWWVSDNMYVSGRFDTFAELTDADWMTGTFYGSDISLSGGYNSIYVIPVVDVELSASATLTIPTSTFSRAETLLLGTGVEVAASRSFPVLGGLQIGYSFEFSKAWHEYTTTAGGARLEGPCALGVNADRCGFEVGSGERNVSWTVNNTLNASITINDWISGVVAGGLGVGQLYGAEESDPRESNSVSDPTHARYHALTMAKVMFFSSNIISGSLGLVSFHTQQMPDSSLRSPFLNRFTRITADLIVDLDDALHLEILQ